MEGIATIMINLQRTNSGNTDFQQLVAELDKDLAIKNGEKNDFFAQFNAIDVMNHVVVAYQDHQPVGCGAIKAYNATKMEVKRMFVLPEMRGKGIAVMVLKELEQWAKELGYTTCILETGDQMTAAIRLYNKSGYCVIPNYGQYERVESSICFEKFI